MSEIGNGKEASVSLVVSGGEVLVVWNRRFHTWTLPGGKVNTGETVEAAQERELLEETGLETLVSVRFYSAPSPVEGDRMVHVFAVTPRSYNAKAMEPHCPISWLSLDLLPLQNKLFANFYTDMLKAWYRRRS